MSLTTLAARKTALAALSLVAVELLRRWRRRRLDTRQSVPQPCLFSKANDVTAIVNDVKALPKWLQWIADGPETYRVLMREWEDPAWRRQQGWKGWDLIHGPDSAVSIPCYYLNVRDKALRGPVTFGKNSESHRGLCHGGAMTSAMDDVLGHVCFMAVGEGPWTGATVQVNVKLKKPVSIGQTLLLEGKVTNVERKKVSIEATLSDEAGQEYAVMSGLSIAGAKLQPVETELDRRTWWFDEGRRIMFDSAWDIPSGSMARSDFMKTFTSAGPIMGA